MEITDVNTLSSECTAHRIVLMNDSVLECYPKAGDNEQPSQEPSEEENRAFFYKHAFLFYRNAHRILSDSRMFLAPVSIQPFYHEIPLGAYVELWLNCGLDLTKDNQGRDAITCTFAGSPCSGCNRCTCVYPDGHVARITHGGFISIYGLFQQIRGRYKEAKGKYQAYTLQQVADMLMAAGETRESELGTQLEIAKANAHRQTRRFENLEKQYQKLEEKYHDLVMIHHKADLEAFREEYLAKKRQSVKFNELQMFKLQRTKAIMDKGHISRAEIERYLEQ